MNGPDSHQFEEDLSDDDKIHIAEVFFERIVPKLRNLNARIGNVNCDFAGDRYRNWTIRFHSKGQDFGISAFEYDEDGDSMELDL